MLSAVLIAEQLFCLKVCVSISVIQVNVTSAVLLWTLKSSQGGKYMAANSDELAKLLAMRTALSEAIKSQRRLDNCHSRYIEKTNNVGFSRSLTTTYNANASSNAAALKSDMDSLKTATQAVFNF